MSGSWRRLVGSWRRGGLGGRERRGVRTFIARVEEQISGMVFAL